MPSNSFDTEDHSHKHQLPTEIIEEVVDNLHDNNEALKAISLSSPIFLHHARKHLFETFVLQPQDVTENGTLPLLPSDKTFGLIKSAPHLIPYIQVLEIGDSLKTPLLEFDEEFSKALCLLHQTLETKMATLSLRHLYLHHFIWSKLSIELQAAIQRLLGLGSLKMVTFHWTTNVLWTVLREISSNVTALTLDEAYFEPDIGPRRDPAPAPLMTESGIDRLRIEALYIANGMLGYDPTIILTNDPIFPLDLTHLRTFWIHISWWIRHQRVFSHVSRSLETLGINFLSFNGVMTPNAVVPFTGLALPPLDCRHLDNLKHLHIQTSDAFGRLALQSAFLWLCESLETLPRQHQLQSIGIRCGIGIAECRAYQSNHGPWPEVKRGLGWEHIDMFLTQPRFHSLRQIRVDFGPGLGVKALNEPEYSAIVRSIPVLLPRVMAKGIVVLNNYKENPRLPYWNITSSGSMSSPVVRFK